MLWLELKGCHVAKELPYFKFEPSQWENGNIQLCGFEAQGVFINVCSMYWQRLGNLPYKLAVQKICNGNATALDSLCEEEVIKVIDGDICIDFLNEQLSEFENTSKVNSQNALEGWIKRRNKANLSNKNAVALQPHSEPNAIRGEEMRGEKMRESYTHAKEAFEDITSNYLETEPQRNIIKNKGWTSATEKDIKALLYHYLELQGDLTLRTKSDIKKHFRSWLNKYDVTELQKISKQIHGRQAAKVS